MFTYRVNSFIVFAFWLLAASCTGTRKATTPVTGIGGLKYLGTYEIPYNLPFDNTVVGGLSGIDYDSKTGLYYLISDDRSDKNPARFYTAHIYLSQKGIDSVGFTGVHYLLQPGGATYPNGKENPFKTPDPEAIRYNPRNDILVWSSEGERIVKPADTVLVDPSVLLLHTNGLYKDSFSLPPNLHMQATEKGPRRNGVFEGMSFADNYNTLYVNVEEPLYEDGPRADVVDANTYIRILKFDVARRKCLAQYAYKLAPVAHAAIPPDGFKINGVPDIMSLGNKRLLVIERSFSSGRLPCTIRLYIADLNEATDISNLELKQNTRFKPAAKKLLLNMDELGIYTDNIEGVTFGPTLSNGHKSLLFIADNNFSAMQRTQVLLFEVLE